MNPIEEQREASATLRRIQANAIPFRDAATAYIEIHEPSWQNAKHAQQWRNSLAAYAFPVMGDLIIGEVETQHILRALESIWRTKTETATRVRSRIEAILDWAATMGYREGVNPARWKGHLSNLLPSPKKIAKEKHFPALPVPLAGAFMAELRTMPGIGARALEFGILTAARSGEVRGAT